MAIKVNKTKTGTQPISLEEAKSWLRVDTDADDVLITSLITEAIDLAEYWLNLAIVDQTVILQASERIALDLFYKPIITITSVKDLDGIDLEYNFDGFTITLLRSSSLIVNYDAGYEDAVPEGLVVGLKELVAYLYENRGDIEQVDKARFVKKNLAAYNKTLW